MPTTAYYTNLPGTLGGPLSIRRGGQSRFVLPDMQGNVRQLTDSTGVVTDTLTTDAFGVQKASSGGTVNPFKAYGQWGYFTDTPSRLYVRARELRVDLGRWISRDPIGFEGGDWNLYGYVGNNAVKQIDPSGLQVGCPIDPCTDCYTSTHDAQGRLCCGRNPKSFDDVRKIANAKLNAVYCFTTGKWPKSSVLGVLSDVLACIAQGESERDPHCYTPATEGLPDVYGLYQLDWGQWFRCGGGPKKICNPEANTSVRVDQLISRCKNYEGNMFDALWKGMEAFRKADFRACIKSRGIDYDTMKQLLKSVTCGGCTTIKGCY